MNIETLFAEWQALQPLRPENQEVLDRKFRLEFNYNSNHIEGNTLTYGQTEVLFMTGNTSDNAPMKDWEEMKAHNVALRLVKQEAGDVSRPLTERFIKDVHRIMLCEDYDKYIIEDGIQKVITIHAGTYKERRNSVITKTGEKFEYASPEETPALMADLVSWYCEEESRHKYKPIELAAMFHYRYIRIHPFDDGNGRIARLMVNYILFKHGYPMIVVKADDKQNYLMALGQCDVNTGVVPSDGAHAELEQITPLVNYLEKCLEQALVQGIKAAVGDNIEDDDDLQKRIAILARNAKANREGVKRKNTIFVNEIINDFLSPFQNKLMDGLAPFSQFYSKIEVPLMAVVSQGLSLPIYSGYVESHQDELEKVSSNMYIYVHLGNPTILLPAKSGETVNFYISCKEEGYEITISDKTFSFRYGVLPTDSQQKEWIKIITQDLYESIERKVQANK